jgi:hypothetical protein
MAPKAAQKKSPAAQKLAKQGAPVTAPTKRQGKAVLAPVVPITVKSLVKPRPAPIPLAAAQPRPDPSSIARKAMQLRQQVGKKVDGYGAPAPVVRKVAEYLIRFEDGTVLHAVGPHADVLVRFTDECNSICLAEGKAYYDGPAMTKYTPEEWAARQL